MSETENEEHIGFKINSIELNLAYDPKEKKIYAEFVDSDVVEEFKEGIRKEVDAIDKKMKEEEDEEKKTELKQQVRELWMKENKAETLVERKKRYYSIFFRPQEGGDYVSLATYIETLSEAHNIWSETA